MEVGRHHGINSGYGEGDAGEAATARIDYTKIWARKTGKTNIHKK